MATTRNMHAATRSGAIHTDEQDYRQGGSGNYKYMGLRWSPNEVPTKIHLGEPEHFYDNGGIELPWKIIFQHYIPWLGKNGQYITCSDNCVVCAYTNPQKFNLDIAPDPKLAKVNRNMTVVTSGWIEEMHHLVPKKSAKGTEYHELAMCSKDRMGCDYCKSNLPKVFGKRMYTQISAPAWRLVWEPLMDRVQQYCRCGGQLVVQDYRCTCGAVMFDFLSHCQQCGSEDVNVSLDDGMATCGKCRAQWSIYESDNPTFRRTVRHPATCPTCNASVVASPNLVCALGNCPNKPDPYSIYDVSVTIRKDDKNVKVDKWKPAEPDARLFDPDWQGGRDNQAAEARAAANAVPIDIDEALPILSPEIQAKQLGVENPWRSGIPDAEVQRRSRTGNYPAT